MNFFKLAEGPVFVFSGAFAISVSYILNTVIEERLNKKKSLQMVSGLKFASFYIGNFIFDVLSL